MKMNYTKQRRTQQPTTIKPSEFNYQVNQAYLRMSMVDRIKHNGEPCKSCGK